jgi:hypothetical protein
MAFYFSDVADNYVSFTEVGSELSPGTGDFTLLARVLPLVVSYGALQQGTIYSRDFTGLELLFYQSTVGVYCGGAGNNPTGANATTIQIYYHIGARRSGTSLRVHANVNNNSATNSANASGSGAVYLGTRPSGAGTADLSYSGHMQDVALWKGAALTDREIDSHNRGFPARRIRPGSLSLDANMIRMTNANRQRGSTWSVGANAPATNQRHLPSYGV